MNCCVHHFHLVHLRMNIEALEHRRKNGRRSNHVRPSDTPCLPLSALCSFSHPFFFMSILYLVSLSRFCGIRQLFGNLQLLSGVAEGQTGYNRAPRAEFFTIHNTINRSSRNVSQAYMFDFSSLLGQHKRLFYTGVIEARKDEGKEQKISRTEEGKQARPGCLSMSSSDWDQCSLLRPPHGVLSVTLKHDSRIVLTGGTKTPARGL